MGNAHDIAENRCDTIDGCRDARGLQIAFAADFQNRDHRKVRKDYRGGNHRDELRSQGLKCSHHKISTSDVNI